MRLSFRDQDGAKLGYAVDQRFVYQSYIIRMSKPLDRLTLLATFVRIAEAGSLSAAARDLGLTQPSVSRQLVALETRLQAQLVRRTTHSLALTEAGQDLLADARQLLDGWETLAEKHQRATTEVRGRLKVVAPIALGQLGLADFAVRFQQLHPGVALTWQLEDHALRFAEVGCDCWIKVGPVPDDTLIVRPLGQVERLLVAAPALLKDRAVPSHPRHLADLPGVALAPFEGQQLALTSTAGASAVLMPAVTLTTNNIFVLHRAALQGLGVAILPRWFVEADLKAGRLIDVLPTWRAAALAIHVAYLPGRHRPRRLQVFLEALHDAVAALPGIEAAPA